MDGVFTLKGGGWLWLWWRWGLGGGGLSVSASTDFGRSCVENSERLATAANFSAVKRPELASPS